MQTCDALESTANRDANDRVFVEIDKDYIVISWQMFVFCVAYFLQKRFRELYGETKSLDNCIITDIDKYQFLETRRIDAIKT